MLFSTTLVSSLAIVASMATAAILPRHSNAAGDYTLVFSGQDAAVQGTDFITFALVDTTHECTDFCDSVSACGFANSYHDNNGKGGATGLTCSLYVGCHDETDLTNTGGQTQPDGTVNFITDSDGWCKVVTPPPETTTPPPATTDPVTDPTTDPAPEPTSTDVTTAS